ncbi:hypothetical protein, partial [Patulibacter sp.]|uniref:hypothetical protein n=1 Tax=Patulibacter sp. TaxID=1912859 RepID=UPI002728FBEB
MGVVPRDARSATPVAGVARRPLSGTVVALTATALLALPAGAGAAGRVTSDGGPRLGSASTAKRWAARAA